MAKEIKFTEEEVGKINQLRQDVSNVFTQLGQLAIEKNRRIQEVEKVENELIEKHGNLQNQEKELFESLNEKYGDGNYDPTTNVFTPVEKTEETVTEEQK
jgi:predicted transcriptional regulator|tara:strand:- start:66 stop:365 length:300 start_codon:yes stop_codon:yes gene_type:complete